MKIRPFDIEQWMNEFENHCAYNLGETCVASLTVEQLLELSGKRETILSDLLPMKLTYGAIEGSERLRNGICAICYCVLHHAARSLDGDAFCQVSRLVDIAVAQQRDMVGQQL